MWRFSLAVSRRRLSPHGFEPWCPKLGEIIVARQVEAYSEDTPYGSRKRRDELPYQLMFPRFPDSPHHSAMGKRFKN
jgi:hypothetical protein